MSTLRSRAYDVWPARRRAPCPARRACSTGRCPGSDDASSTRYRKSTPQPELLVALGCLQRAGKVGDLGGHVPPGGERCHHDHQAELTPGLGRLLRDGVPVHGRERVLAASGGGGAA
jgi:hypothetical protein